MPYPQIVRHGNSQIDLRDTASHDPPYDEALARRLAALSVYLRAAGADSFAGPSATAIWRAWCALGTELPDPEPDAPGPVLPPPAPDPAPATRCREAGDAVVISRPDGKGDAIIVVDDNQLVFKVPRGEFDREADVFLVGFPPDAVMWAALRSPHPNAIAASATIRTDAAGRGWIYLAAGVSLTFEPEPKPKATS